MCPLLLALQSLSPSLSQPYTTFQQSDRTQAKEGSLGFDANLGMLLGVILTSKTLVDIFSSLVNMLAHPIFSRFPVCPCCRYAGFVTCLSYESHGGGVTRIKAKFERLDGRKPPKVCLAHLVRAALLSHHD